VKHRTVRNHFAEFTSKDIPVSKVDGVMVNDFHHFLITKKGISNNTTIKYVRSVGKILNIADEKNYIVKSPMKQYKVKQEKKRSKSLTREELKAIEGLDLSHESDRSFDIVRDSFVFCCYTGLSYSDVKRLKMSQISESKGIKIVLYNRKKNDRESGFLLLDEPVAIIDKYAEERKILNSDLVMPVFSNQQSNKALKTIQKLAGIDPDRINLTFHVSRHTFASTVTLREGLDISRVSKAMGHSSIKQTEHYAELLPDNVIEDMIALRDRLRKAKEDELSEAKEDDPIGPPIDFAKLRVI